MKYDIDFYHIDYLNKLFAFKFHLSSLSMEFFLIKSMSLDNASCTNLEYDMYFILKLILTTRSVEISGHFSICSLQFASFHYMNIFVNIQLS